MRWTWSLHIKTNRKSILLHIFVKFMVCSGMPIKEKSLLLLDENVQLFLSFQFNDIQLTTLNNRRQELWNALNISKFFSTFYRSILLLLFYHLIGKSLCVEMGCIIEFRSRSPIHINSIDLSSIVTILLCVYWLYRCRLEEFLWHLCFQLIAATWFHYKAIKFVWLALVLYGSSILDYIWIILDSLSCSVLFLRETKNKHTAKPSMGSS